MWRVGCYGSSKPRRFMSVAFYSSGQYNRSKYIVACSVQDYDVLSRIECFSNRFNCNCRIHERLDSPNEENASTQYLIRHFYIREDLQYFSTLCCQILQRFASARRRSFHPRQRAPTTSFASSPQEQTSLRHLSSQILLSALN